MRKLDSIFVYPVDGDAYMELSCDNECFAEIRISKGELVIDFVGEINEVPLDWMTSQIEVARARARDEQGNLRGFKLDLGSDGFGNRERNS